MNSEGDRKEKMVYSVWTQISTYRKVWILKSQIKTEVEYAMKRGRPRPRMGWFEFLLHQLEVGSYKQKYSDSMTFYIHDALSPSIFCAVV